MTEKDGLTGKADGPKIVVIWIVPEKVAGKLYRDTDIVYHVMVVVKPTVGRWRDE